MGSCREFLRFRGRRFTLRSAMLSAVDTFGWLVKVGTSSFTAHFRQILNCILHFVLLALKSVALKTVYSITIMKVCPHSFTRSHTGRFKGKQDLGANDSYGPTPMTYGSCIHVSTLHQLLSIASGGLWAT
eukprot:scaffold267788_cov31-Prasinocladus_malaysianus.AAC.2